MDWERFGRTRKVCGEQRGVEVQCAPMGAQTALIGYGEAEDVEKMLRLELWGHDYLACGKLFPNWLQNANAIKHS